MLGSAVVPMCFCIVWDLSRSLTAALLTAAFLTFGKSFNMAVYAHVIICSMIYTIAKLIPYPCINRKFGGSDARRAYENVDKFCLMKSGGATLEAGVKT